MLVFEVEVGGWGFEVVTAGDGEEAPVGERGSKDLRSDHLGMCRHSPPASH